MKLPKSNINKYLDKNGYLLSKHFYRVISKNLGGWQLGGICPICNKWHLAIIKCKDVDKYNKTWNEISDKIKNNDLN